MKGSYYYLATPYTGNEEYLYEMALRAQMALLRENEVIVYSPIVSWHVAANVLRHPTDAASFWKVNRAFLRQSQGVIMCDFPGWDRSVGVAQELAYAREHSIPTYIATCGPPPEHKITIRAFPHENHPNARAN